MPTVSFTRLQLDSLALGIVTVGLEESTSVSDIKSSGNVMLFERPEVQAFFKFRDHTENHSLSSDKVLFEVSVKSKV